MADHSVEPSIESAIMLFRQSNYQWMCEFEVNISRKLYDIWCRRCIKKWQGEMFT